MRLIFAILAVLGLGFSPAHANGKRLDCGEKCLFYKHSPGTRLRPAVPGMVCFRFVQPAPDFVEFTLYSPDKQVVIRIKHKVPDGTTGQFCVGPQYVRRSVWVEICNQINHSNRGVPSLANGLRTGFVDMCLLGKDCPRFVQ